MTPAELREIVQQRSKQPSVLGRLACNLHSDECEQDNADGRLLEVRWQHLGGFWRCCISTTDGSSQVAKVDVHESSTVHMQAFEPCSITVSPEDGVLCLTRHKFPA